MYVDVKICVFNLTNVNNILFYYVPRDCFQILVNQGRAKEMHCVKKDDIQESLPNHFRDIGERRS